MSKKRARGVTLVEVLIVVAILAIIAGAVAVFAIPHFMDAQKDTAKMDCKTLVSIVEAHRLTQGDQSVCPTIEQLRAGGAMRRDQKLDDPWGHPYRIVCEGPNVGVTSLGPDGQPGTPDDISAGLSPKK